MATPDETIHQSLRLKIMAALYTDLDGEPWEFGRLKKVTEATDGNLGSHLATLEQAGYVAIEKTSSAKSRGPAFRSPAKAVALFAATSPIFAKSWMRWNRERSGSGHGNSPTQLEIQRQGAKN